MFLNHNSELFGARFNLICDDMLIQKKKSSVFIMLPRELSHAQSR